MPTESSLRRYVQGQGRTDVAGRQTHSGLRTKPGTHTVNVKRRRGVDVHAERLSLREVRATHAAALHDVIRAEARQTVGMPATGSRGERERVSNSCASV